MNHLLYKAWKEFQKKNLITPEIYFEETSLFQEDLFLAAKQSKEIDSAISYPLKSVGSLGEIFSDDRENYFYARHNSKEEDILCQLLVQAEAGYLKRKGINPADYIAATIFPSGMNAIYTVLQSLVSAIQKNERKNKRFLQPMAEELYPDTNYVLYELMHELGLKAPLRVKINDEQSLAMLLQYNHQDIIGIYYEPISSASISYTDTRKIRELADWYNIPIIVDNTTLTPYLQQQFRLGADIIIHSLSKYIGGEGDCLGGAVIGQNDFIKPIRKLQKAIGNVIQAPIISHFFSRQLTSLSQRMDEHITNAKLLVDYLKSSPYIESVCYPNLNKHTRYGAAGGLFRFMLHGEDENEKKIKETKFLEYIINHPESGFIYKVSYGEEKHLVFGESTHGVITKLPAGAIRLAAGRLPSAKDVIPYIENALKYAYEKK